MTREKKYFAPTLYPLSKDMSRVWFIRYKVKDYVKGELVPKSYKGYLNLEPDYEKRLMLASEYIEQINQGILPEDVRGARAIIPTLPKKSFADTGQIFEQTLEYLLPTLERPTQVKYRSTVNIFKTWLYNEGYATLPIGQFDRVKAKAFLMYLRVERKYKSQSYNGVKGCLAMIYDEILDTIDELQTVNPFRQLKPMPDNSESFTAYPKALRAHIANSMPSEDMQLWIAVQFLYYNFVRIRELSRLKISDIDFTTGLITIRSNVNLKSKKSRVMCVGASLIECLQRNGYDKYPPDYFIFGVKGLPNDTHVGSNHLSNKWREYKKRHEIGDIYKLYGAKHTGNTTLATSGISATLQMLHNGHADLATTQRYIDKFSIDIEKLREVAAAVPVFGT